PVSAADRDASLAGWRTADVPALTTTIDRLLDSVKAHTEPNTFDIIATATLAERRTMLTHLPTLTAQVDEQLTVQVSHGDYSPVNRLHTSTAVFATVLDFG